MQTARNSEMEVAAVERRPRRHRPKQERRQIAEESLQPGVSVAVVARRHGVNANQVFHWRKLLGQGRLDVKPNPTQLMPVRITGVGEDKSLPVHQQTGVIQIELGRARIRVEGAVDPDMLRAVLEQLGR
jgi:transposase